MTTPLLLVKVGHYPMHHGGLTLARSMGAVGVPVAAMVERRLTPLALSRHVKWRFPPLVLKNQQSFSRLRAPAVGGTTILSTTAELEQ